MYLLTTFKRGKDLKKRKARFLNRSTKTAIGSGLGGILGTGASKLLNKNKKLAVVSGLVIGGIAGNKYGKEENKYNKSPLFYKAKVNSKEGYEKLRNKTKKVIKKVNSISNKIENYSTKPLTTFGIFTVKASVRKGKKGTYTVKQHTRKRKDKIVTVENGAKAVSAIVGVTALGYLAAKGRYRGKMQKTLANAVKKAETIDVSKFKISPKNNSLTFTVAGTGGLQNALDHSKGVAGAVKGITRNRNVFDIPNTRFNLKSSFNNKIVTKEVEDALTSWKNINTNATKEQIAEQAFNLRTQVQKKYMNIDHPIGVAKQLYKTYIKRGTNKQTEDTLATIIALHKKTGMPVNLVGTSGGGIVMDEVSEHLTNLKIPHKGINLGSPNFGFTKPNKSVIGVAGKKDPLTNLLPTHNRKTVNGGRGHDIPDYFMDKEVQKLFKEHLYQ